MNFYPNIATWPRNLNRDRQWTWELAGTTIAGGRALSGLMPRARFDGGGMWKATLADIRALRLDEVRAFRAMAARADGGAAPFVMEMREPDIPPWPLDANGKPIAAQYQSAHSDGSGFSDGSGYVSDVINAQVAAAAALRATSLALQLDHASGLRGGEHFSIQHDTFSHRLYRIGKVLAAAEASGEGNDGATKVLLDFWGDDGATVIEDRAVGAADVHAWTLNGGAVLDTDVRVLGLPMLLLSGAAFASTPDHADYTLGSGPFAIEGFFDCRAPGGTFEIICGKTIVGSTGANADRSFILLRSPSNVISGTVYVGGASFAATGTTQFTDTVNPGLHHVALVRTAGGRLQLWIDRVMEADIAITGTVNDTNGLFSVGRSGDEAFGVEWTGRLGLFRLSVGADRIVGGAFPVPAKVYGIRSRYSVGIRPPLREATAAGTRAEFDYPKSVMRLVNPEAMRLAMDQRRWGSATIEIEEDFPPFDLVEEVG